MIWKKRSNVCTVLQDSSVEDVSPLSEGSNKCKVRIYFRLLHSAQVVFGVVTCSKSGAPVARVNRTSLHCNLRTNWTEASRQRLVPLNFNTFFLIFLGQVLLQSLSDHEKTWALLYKEAGGCKELEGVHWYEGGKNSLSHHACPMRRFIFISSSDSQSAGRCKWEFICSAPYQSQRCER